MSLGVQRLRNGTILVNGIRVGQIKRYPSQQSAWSFTTWDRREVFCHNKREVEDTAVAAFTRKRGQGF